MNEIGFAEALSAFLDDTKCEEVNEALFELIRSSFTAGWKAAMGFDIKRIMNIEKRQ